MYLKDDKSYMTRYSHIPVKQSKKPNTKLLDEATGQSGWKLFQQRKPTIKEHEAFNQSSHLAILTGEINGITVIDLDNTAEQDLLNKGYVLPETPTMRTQSGGKHLYFKYSDKLQTDSKINEEQNIDIRNNGGYAVATGKGYEWLKHIDDTELLEVPKYFIDMYQNKAIKKVKSVPNTKLPNNENDPFKAARGVNMVTFLRHHGYDVQERHAFSCIFDEHEDNNPSANIYMNEQGENRYKCFSHNNGRLNLSLIDLWTELKGISTSEAVNQILEFIGQRYEVSEFRMQQLEKYHHNTATVGDLEYIRINFPYLYKYLTRYELELRALMDYAEFNLKGTDYSHNNEAIFYIPNRFAAKHFADKFHRATINFERTRVFFNILCTLEILNRIPPNEVSSEAKKKTAQFTTKGNEVNFYSFNRMTDRLLSLSDERAETMQASKFKVTTMTKDILISIFGLEAANKVFPDNRGLSENFKAYYNHYEEIILHEIENKGYTTKQEVINQSGLPIAKRTKEYHFDKVINEICNAYNLNFTFQNKQLRAKFQINGRGRKRLLYKG